MATAAPTSPAALAGELHLALAQLVRRLRAASAGHELSWSQLSAMAWLEAGPATIASLARQESVKPQSMGATMRALERAGFVRSRPDATDGRQRLFSLTSSGRRIRVDATRAKRQWLTAVIGEKLDAGERRELRAAIELLRRLQRS